MKFQPTRISVKRPKRLVIIIISAVVILALATYGVLSYLHWQKYDQDSQKAATSLKTAIEGSLGSNKTTPAPSAQIDTIVKDFEKSYGTDPCKTSAWFGWQTVISQLKDMQNKCAVRFETALSVIKALKPLSQYLKDEKKAATLLSATLESTKTPTDYTATAAIWKTAIESADLSKQDEFKTVKTKSTEVMTTISTAYTALASAVSKEDKTAFDKATTDLQTAYSGITDLKTTVNAERDKLITTLVSSYEKL